MKKRLPVLLALLVVTVCLFAVSVSAATTTAYCEHCGAEKTWYSIDENTTKLNTAGYDHYYLTTNRYMTNQSITKTICVNLNNYAYYANKPITVQDGGTLSFQNGGLVSRGNGTNSIAGLACVKSGGTLNLKNAEMTFQVYDDRIIPYGGMLNVEGTVNAENVTMEGGIASVQGGNMYIAATGVVNLTDCDIRDGIAPKSSCVYAAGKLNITGKTSIHELTLEPVEGGPAASEQVTVTGTHTGTVTLQIGPDVLAGTTLVNVNGANISGAAYTVNGVPMVKNANQTGMAAAARVNGVTYATMDEALAAITPGQTLQLAGSVETLTLDKAVTLDLNGCNVDTLTAGGVTVYVMDSQTADYDVTDGIYGKIAAVTGDVKAAEATAATDAYLKIEEEDGASYHAVALNITDMALKAGEAAVYFINNFDADHMVREKILSFGVALSISGAPSAETMLNSKHYTQLDPELFGTDAGDNGSLLYGIMKDENGFSTNTRHAAIPVNGRAYIQVGENEYLFGVNRSRSFQEQIEKSDAIYDEIDWDKRDALMDLYERFAAILKNWTVPNTAAGVEVREENTIRILTIGNSHGQDSNWQLYNVFAKQNPEKRVIVGTMYKSSCTMVQHVQFAEENSPSYTYHKNSNGTWVDMENATLQDGLKDEKWDIVMFQELNTTSGRTSWAPEANIAKLKAYVEAQLGYEPEYYWNMLWANPVSEYFWDEDTRLTGLPDKWVENYEEDFGTNQMTMYNAIVQNVKEHILTGDTFTGGVLPTGTVIQYANNVLGMTDLDLYRDYIHASDFGRLLVAYLWYCTFTGDTIDSVDEVNVDVIPQALRHRNFQAEGDLKITDFMKQVIVDAVNYALENPLEVPTVKVHEDPAEDDTFDVLMIGNSFCNYYTDELVAIAKAAGKQLRLCTVYYGGCRLDQHHTWWKNGEAPYVYREWTTESTKILRVEDVSLEYCLTRRNWDVISSQGASKDLMAKDSAGKLIKDENGIPTIITAQECFDNNKGYLEDLLTYYRSMFPKARYMWHHTWAYQKGDTGSVVTDEANQHAYDATMMEYAKMMCEEFDLDRVPSGVAWRIIRDGGYDSMCNRIGKSVGDAAPNTGDNYHDGDIGGGQYLNACVWFERLFGESVLGNTFVPSYSLPILFDVEDLQNAAHQAVLTLSE